MLTYIDKLAFIDLKEKKILSTLSLGKSVWYIPGGKRESGESDQEALIREVKEELSVQLISETITHYGTFEAQAHGKPEGTLIAFSTFGSRYPKLESSFPFRKESASIWLYTGIPL